MIYVVHCEHDLGLFEADLPGEACVAAAAAFGCCGKGAFLVGGIAHGFADDAFGCHININC